jgi:DNA-binding transcriptional MocR family regulator
VSTLHYRQFEVPDGVIDLGLGQPDASVYPVAQMRAAALALAGGDDHEYCQYGPEYGDRDHRIALAEFLTGAYRLDVDPSLLLTTNGNSQALDLACTVLTSPGDVVIVEEPTYFLARGIFDDHHLRQVGVPVDDDGLDVDALEAQLEALRSAGTPARLVYCIPASQNPTGVTLSLPRRTRLVELAHEYDFLVVADEVYHLLEYGDPGPPPMSAAVDSGRVLSLGTFSKILAPGLRLGWVHAAPDLLTRFVGSGLVISGGGLNPVVSALVTHVMATGGLAANIVALCTEYRTRSAALDAALEQHMPAGVTWRRPTGGYFTWLALPDGVDGAEVRRLGRESMVDVRHGSLFSASGRSDSSIRLSFAHYSADDLAEGAARLGTAVRAALS